MELIFLGSGTGIPSLQKSAPGLVIKVQNEPLLFDSGSGTLTRLLNAGINYLSLNHVFYTHKHSDHTADLIPLIQALRTTPDYERTEHFNLYGPDSFKKFVKLLGQAFGSWLLSPEFPLLIHELKSDVLDFPFGQIRTEPMNHSKAAIGYRVEAENEGSIVYSGDTDYCHEIIELAQRADILILECSFPDDHKVEGHLTPTEAAHIACEAGCHHLILTHLYPPFEKIENEIKIQCRKIYDGRVTIAHDFLNIKL